ncbi:hypothetical protein KEM54_004334 [Ascosphaera aggregata]|nr:hypothetical protein KEM54_004334 [Ascosphaera aggregata]
MALARSDDAYENGSFALLLCLSGTLPVSFRGAIYHFPITLWFPLNYPREAPITYVTPPSRPQSDAAVMTVIRPGQHVSVEGRVYHPLLAGWSEGSSIAELLVKLRDVFAKEPPVISKPVTQQPPPAQVRDIPPPVPPLPPDLDKSRGQHRAPVVEIPQPPPRPPKQSSEPPISRPDSLSSRRERPKQQQSGPPPLPPLPDDFRTAQSGVTESSPPAPAVPLPVPQKVPGPQIELQSAQRSDRTFPQILQQFVELPEAEVPPNPDRADQEYRDGRLPLLEAGS